METIRQNYGRQFIARNSRT